MRQAAHLVLLARLDPPAGDQHRLDAHVVAVHGHAVDDIVDLAPIPAYLPAHMVVHHLQSDEFGDGIIGDDLDDAEAELDVHPGEVAVGLVLCEFVDAPDQVVWRLTEGLTDDLEVPGSPGCADGVPPLGLPLVLLLPSRCSGCRTLGRHRVHVSKVTGATPLAARRPCTTISTTPSGGGQLRTPPKKGGGRVINGR